MTKLTKEEVQGLLPDELIEKKIFLIRGEKVMLDRDLAQLYGVETGQLTRQVRRNLKRFPTDFMIQLNYKEFSDLKCHFGNSSWGNFIAIFYGNFLLSVPRL